MGFVPTCSVVVYIFAQIFASNGQLEWLGALGGLAGKWNPGMPGLPGTADCDANGCTQKAHLPEKFPTMVRPFMGPRVMLSLQKYPYARCLDGTPGAYYYLPGDPKTVIIHLKGGGSCVNWLSCNIRRLTMLGSSKFFPTFMSFRLPGTLANTEEVRNEHLASATMVYVPYCSGDFFSGQTTAPSASTLGFWFSGHHIVDAVLEELIAKRNMSQAELVILTGGSAGGIGSVLHLDHLADKLKGAGSMARVVGAPLAGFQHMNVKPYTGPKRAPYVRSMPQQIVALWNSFLPKRCTAQNVGAEWQCIFGSISARTILSDVMFFTPQTDVYTLRKLYGLPDSPPFDIPEEKQWIEGFIGLQKQVMRATARPGVAFFHPACWTHTYLEGISVQGSTYQEAFVTFLNAPRQTLLYQDECGEVNCNPSCMPVKASESLNNLASDVLLSAR